MRRHSSPRARFDYERSNLIERLDYAPSPETLELARQVLTVAPHCRGQASQVLLDRMAAELKVCPVKLHFKDQPQKHRRRNGRLTYKEYAHYEADGITIYNKTAVRQQYLASKSYLDTLVHEFLHHLDYRLLGLQYTFHTQGFYRRLADLMAKLQASGPGQLELFEAVTPSK